MLSHLIEYSGWYAGNPDADWVMAQAAGRGKLEDVNEAFQRVWADSKSRFRWWEDRTSLGTYGDYLLAKVSKVFPELRSVL